MMAWRDWLAAGYADAAAGVAAFGVPALAGVAAADVPAPLLGGRPSAAVLPAACRLGRAPPAAAAGWEGAWAAATAPLGGVPVGCTMVRSSAAIGATSGDSTAHCRPRETASLDPDHDRMH